ncbi:MAG TPA: hypothetical protein VF550_10905 [Polyangia bacterium]
MASDGSSNLPLAAGKPCTFSIVFKPSAVGLSAANVSVSAPGGPTATLPIKGVGATTARSDGGTYVDGDALGSDGKAGTDGGTGGLQVDGGASG